MRDEDVALYAKAMGRIQPAQTLNARVIQAIREDNGNTPTILIGATGRDTLPARAQLPVRAQSEFSSGRMPVWRTHTGMMSIAASFLMVLILMIGGYRLVLTPTSWVDVDINPSVELGLNRLNRVVDVKGVNDDGRTIIEQVSLFGDRPEAAVQAIVEAASSMGYFSKVESNVVALTVITKNEEAGKDLAERIRTGTDAALAQEGLSAEIVEQMMVPERVQRAFSLHNEGVDISPGKLNLIEKLGEMHREAVSAGAEVEAYHEEDYYGRSVKDIQEQAKQYRREIQEPRSETAPGQVKKQEGEENSGVVDARGEANNRKSNPGKGSSGGK